MLRVGSLLFYLACYASPSLAGTVMKLDRYSSPGCTQEGPSTLLEAGGCFAVGGDSVQLKESNTNTLSAAYHNNSLDCSGTSSKTQLVGYGTCLRFTSGSLRVSRASAPEWRPDVPGTLTLRPCSGSTDCTTGCSDARSFIPADGTCVAHSDLALPSAIVTCASSGAVTIIGFPDSATTAPCGVMNGVSISTANTNLTLKSATVVTVSRSLCLPPPPRTFDAARPPSASTSASVAGCVPSGTSCDVACKEHNGGQCVFALSNVAASLTHTRRITDGAAIPQGAVVGCARNAYPTYSDTSSTNPQSTTTSTTTTSPGSDGVCRGGTKITVGCLVPSGNLSADVRRFDSVSAIVRFARGMKASYILPGTTSNAFCDEAGYPLRCPGGEGAVCSRCFEIATTAPVPVAEGAGGMTTLGGTGVAEQRDVAASSTLNSLVGRSAEAVELRQSRRGKVVVVCSGVGTEVHNCLAAATCGSFGIGGAQCYGADGQLVSCPGCSVINATNTQALLWLVLVLITLLILGGVAAVVFHYWLQDGERAKSLSGRGGMYDARTMPPDGPPPAITMGEVGVAQKGVSLEGLQGAGFGAGTMSIPHGGDRYGDSGAYLDRGAVVFDPA